jgi:hypothetical protein
MYKKIISISLILLLMFSFSTVFATQTQKPSLSYKEYAELKANNYIGKDISYDYLKKINDEAKKLEETLDNNTKFTKYSLYSLATLKAGDILITNATSSSGIVGHAAIAISSNEILHIAGFGQKVEVNSINNFKNRYSSGWIKVYRLNNSTIAGRAASWARTNYKGSNAVYKITTNLTTKTETYCSKIVFQAYYFGGSSAVVGPKFTLTGTVMPYVLPSLFSGGSYSCNKIGEL